MVPEVVAKDLRKWLADTGATTLYIEPGSPWENDYCESFNSNFGTNSSILRSSTPSKSFARWPNPDASTTTPSDRTPYWDTSHQAWLTNSRGMEKWKTATRFPLLHTPDGDYLNSEINALH